MSHFLYAETAFHHEGDMEYMISLIDLAKDSGAHGIKFQVLLDYDSLIARSNPGYDDFKRAMFIAKEWAEIINYTRQKELKVVFMPCDLQSIQCLMDGTFHADYLDLHSVSFYDEALNNAMKATGIPLILGVGGRTLEEMKQKQSFYGDQLWCLMVGFQAFPTKLSDVQIEKISMMRSIFPSLKIGYADHSHYDSENGVNSNLRAANLGADVFEKHLTLNEGEERFDHIASVGEEKFKRISELLKKADFGTENLEVDLALFELKDAEIDYRNRQKIAVAKKDMEAGEKLTSDDINYKMCGSVDGFTSQDEIYGKLLKSAIKYDHPFTTENLMND